MRCIFCKEDSHRSRSAEHIIPESLGNIEHILPKGVVCDKCNNYFSREIEKPLLDSHYFHYARSRNRIPTKKGKYPSSKAYHTESGTVVELAYDEDGWCIFPSQEEDGHKFIESLLATSYGSLVVPHPVEPSKDDHYLVSRFLGKVALEVLAQRVLDIESGLSEIVDKPELDDLRNYVRRGSQSLLWLYHERRIYPENAYFVSEDGEPYEVLHEYTLLYTKTSELYLVIAILGVEYALNMGGPEIDGYLNWLKANGEKSPLYP
jgi:hypothetical protein